MDRPGFAGYIRAYQSNMGEYILHYRVAIFWRVLVCALFWALIADIIFVSFHGR